MEYANGATAASSTEAGRQMNQGDAVDNYNVAVNVSEPEPRVLLLRINPERVQLSGKDKNTITWKLNDAGAEFQSADDISFMTELGKNRFDVSFDPTTKVITAKVKGEEDNQIIYTYLLTVHFPKYNVALRVDPEVDNPPPPPVP
jgi:hypothetical protein